MQMVHAWSVELLLPKPQAKPMNMYTKKKAEEALKAEKEAKIKREEFEKEKVAQLKVGSLGLHMT